MLGEDIWRIILGFMLPADILALVLTSTRMHALLCSLNYAARIPPSIVLSPSTMHPDLFNWYTLSEPHFSFWEKVSLSIDLGPSHIPYVARFFQYVHDLAMAPRCSCLVCHRISIVVQNTLNILHSRVSNSNVSASSLVAWLPYTVFTDTMSLSSLVVILPHAIARTPEAVPEIIAHAVSRPGARVHQALTDPHHYHYADELISELTRILASDFSILAAVAARSPDFVASLSQLPLLCLERSCVCFLGCLANTCVPPPSTFDFFLIPLIRRMLLIDPPLDTPPRQVYRTDNLSPVYIPGLPPIPPALYQLFYHLFTSPSLTKPGCCLIAPVIQHLTAPVHRRLFAEISHVGSNLLRDHYKAAIALLD
jgi:hypothetical protein